MTPETLYLERTIKAPVSQAYRAFTSATAFREWFCDAALADPRPGGRLYVWWTSGYYACGEYIDVEPDDHVAFTWYGRKEPGVTRVHVALAGEEDGTHVMLTHSEFAEGWEKAREQAQRGWETALENLQSVLETGRDLRYVRRPMLGIMVGEFDADISADLGLPVSEGIRLDGVIEGMGAAAAGLKRDDVIVAIDAAWITNWPSLSQALSKRVAGDRVEVTFYRDREKKQTTLALSGRPLPEVPQDPRQLAEAVRRVYTGADAELAEFLSKVTDAEASHRPGPEEWSAKETLAHLIAGERERQAWIADLINDDERWSDRWENPTNVSARVRGTVIAFPTVKGLLDELTRNRAETVAMLAQLPPAFVARKSSYIRLGYTLLETPDYHVNSHLKQIRQAVEAARHEAASG